MPAHSKFRGFSSRGNFRSGSTLNLNSLLDKNSSSSDLSSIPPSKGAMSPFFRLIAWARVNFGNKLINSKIATVFFFIFNMFQHPKKFVFFLQSRGFIVSGNSPEQKTDKSEPWDDIDDIDKPTH